MEKVPENDDFEEDEDTMMMNLKRRKDLVNIMTLFLNEIRNARKFL